MLNNVKYKMIYFYNILFILSIKKLRKINILFFLFRKNIKHFDFFYRKKNL